MRTVIILMLAGLFSFVIATLSVFLSYSIGIELYPSTYTLENGEVIKGMPMAQFFISLINHLQHLLIQRQICKAIFMLEMVI